MLQAVFWFNGLTVGWGRNDVEGILMSPTFLVMGAHDLIGAWIVKRLWAQQADVVILDCTQMRGACGKLWTMTNCHNRSLSQVTSRMPIS